MRALLLAATMVVLAACGGSFETYTTWPGGRLSVLRGDADLSRERMGLWVYYDADGEVEYEREFGDGTKITGTGIYEHGVRVRMPTEEELVDARRRADAIETKLRH